MTVQIDTTAENNGVRFVVQGAHPSAPSAGHVLLYYITGTANPGMFVEDNAGHKYGPFITGSSGGGSITEYDYVESTGTLSVTATTEGTAQTFITGNSVSYDGSTKICVEFFCPRARASTDAANRYMVIDLYQDSTILGHYALLRTPAAGSDDKTVFARRFITPSAGSHAYIVKAYVSGGTGEFTPEPGGTGASLPAYLRVTKA